MKKLIFILLILIQFPLFASALHERGKTAYIYRNYDKAKEYFLKDIEKNEKGDSYYFMGEIEKLQKNYKQAFEYYEKAVTKRMTRKYKINAYWNLIVLTEGTNDYNKVVHYCREMWNNTRAKSAKRKVESLINKLLWTNNKEAIEKYKSGLKLMKRKKNVEALTLFKEASSLDSSFLAPKFELGMHAYNQNNEAEALRYLSEISDKIPFYAEIQLILGDINFSNRNYPTAINNFTAVIDFGFISRSLRKKTILKRGNCYYHTGQYDLAEKDITESIKHMRKNISAHILLSAIYIKQSKLDKALTILKRGNRLSRDNSVILFQLGSIYYHKKDWRYISYFERLFDKTDKNNQKKFQSYEKAFTILLNALAEKGKYTKATAVGEALAKYSSNYSTLIVLARSYYFTGKLEKSIETFEKISIDNKNKLILSKAYIRTGRKQKAKEMLKSISYDSATMSEAKKERLLQPIIKEIDAEKVQPINSGNIQTK